MAITRRGLKCVLNFPKEIKPITDVPDGKHRLKMRPGCAVRLFVRTANGIHRFWLEDLGDTWKARKEGCNVRLG